MRMAAVEKMGYYPTPEETLRRIVAALTAQPGPGLHRILDPCAGEGEALAAVAQHLRATGARVAAYGVELSPARAKTARERLDEVLAVAWEETTVSSQAFSLLWLNPPYDWDGATEEGRKAARLEYLFLRNAWDRLAPGGVLVYIVPRRLLANRRVGRILGAHFADLAVYRLPTGEYEQFHQVVVLAVRRPQPATPEVVEGTVQALARVAQAEEPPELPRDPIRTYVVPAVSEDKTFHFRRKHVPPEEALALAMEHGVHRTAAWQDALATRKAQVFRPAMPLRRGHLAMLMAAGLLEPTVLPGGLVVKGRADKVVDVVDVDAETERSTVQERFVTRVFVLDRQGELEILQDASGLEAFLERHAATLARRIEAAFRPRYLEPTPSEWTALDGLLPHKRLPGRSQAGLLDAQRHVAIAAARTLRDLGHAAIVAEMGFGKTATSLAVLHLLNAFPALVLCPGHMVAKWAREVTEVLPGARAVILDGLEDLWTMVREHRPGERLVAVLSKERAKLGPGWRPAVAWRRIGRGVRAPVCPRCGAVATDRDGVILDIQDMRRPAHCHRCGEILASFDRIRRWPLADVIRKKLPGFFHVLVADEVHQYKAKDSDQGRIFQQLVNACRGRVLSLTGTVFGGKSTSLFWLLYRMDHRVRSDFSFHDERRWSEQYGRLEFTVKEEDVTAGVLSGRLRRRSRVRELPGISPRIVERLLPAAIFAKVADLGYDMPEYGEEIVRIPMDPDQAEQVHAMEELLKAKMLEARQEGDPGWAAVWLQNGLARPNSAFRTEVVERKIRDPRGRIVATEQVMELPPVTTEDELLPKEAWLVDFCRAEAAQGRKVLVYVRQTGERDIQPRLAQALQRTGLSVAVLPDSVRPAHREAWIREHAPALDVLITNPRRVETGLDLVQFATCVFYEIEYSLYTLWQAMRRVWRLGQTRPVKVVYAVYEDTLEEAALGLMGEKLKAALLLYGDGASSAIAEEAGDGDFLTELARRVMAGYRPRIDGLNGLFRPETRTTARSWGALTQESPRLSATVGVCAEEYVQLSLF